MEQLKELPGRVERVESQILQLRHDMRSEFSAIRGEMRDLRKELREDIRIGVEESQANAALRRGMVDRLDRLLELQQPGNDHY